MFVNFSDIPGHQNLFLDYLNEYENVSGYYANNPHNREEYIKLFKNIAASEKAPRTKLAYLINEQYAGYNPSDSTHENLKLLEDGRTLAVVTGQQLGVLGGPLYTFYKILTAVKLADHLNQRYDDFRFVPVFWLEGDDHDFEEVRWIKLLNGKNEISTVKYGSINEEEEGNKGSVGNLQLDDAINSFFENLDQELRPTDYKEEVLSKLKNIYKPGVTFKEAFKRLIFSLFDKYGLVIFDPQDVNIKTLLKPVFKKEITDFRTHTQKLVNISARLEEVYHAQVKIQPINLFFSTDDGRYLIEPGENNFKLKRKRKQFSYEELMQLIDESPERFSPNVLLRPVCQDYLLPTAFYVGGPGEIAYFAQAMPLYKMYGVAAPVIYPRSSATIIEKSVNGLLDKYNLQLTDVFIKNAALKDKILSAVSDNQLDVIFEKTKTEIELTLDALKEKLFEIDKTISDSSARYRDKILGYIDELKLKSVEAQKKHHETTLRQLDKLSAMVYPEGSLQEREINFVYFVHKYGWEILDKIYDELEINKFEHQIINL